MKPELTCKECGSELFRADFVYQECRTIVIVNCPFCLEPIFSIDKRDLDDNVLKSIYCHSKLYKKQKSRF